jgi:hypothetical protein
MKIVTALFGEEVSPRFDCCTGLLVSGTDGTELPLDFRGQTDSARIGEVVRQRPDVLLCGGIRRCDLVVLAESGIRVIDGLNGEARLAVEQCRSGAFRPGGPEESGMGRPGSSGCCRRR